MRWKIFLSFGASAVILGGAVLLLEQKKTQEIQLPKFCLQEPDRAKRIDCVIEAFQEPIVMYGMKTVLDTVEQEFLKDDASATGGVTACHDILHGIASAAVEAIGDIQLVLASCTNLCTSGCYHGAVERYVAQGGEVAKNMNNLCSGAAEKDRPACFHGLGHGVADLTSYDLLKAFVLCDELETEDARRDCGFGVFMEVFEPSTFGRASLPFPQDLSGFCGSLRGVYAEVCWRQSGGYEYARVRDMKKAFAVCAQAPSSSQQWECGVNLGQNLYFSYQGVAQEILALCKEGKDDEYNACVRGALMSSVTSDPVARHGFDICKEGKEYMKAECYQFLGEHIQYVYGEARREELCAFFPPGECGMMKKQ